MSLSEHDKNTAKFHTLKGQDNEAKYLHIKHRYGWLDNFGTIYNGFIHEAKRVEKVVTFENLEVFFATYTEAMGLEPEFGKRIIDDRVFTLYIFDCDADRLSTHLLQKRDHRINFLFGQGNRILIDNGHPRWILLGKPLMSEIHVDVGLW